MRNRLLLIAVWSAISSPLLAGSTHITDPAKFVDMVYANYAKVLPNGAGPDYSPPTDIYTPHLAKLMAQDQAGDGVGNLDFDFWVNGQDYRISDVHVSVLKTAGNSKEIVARFKNMDTPEETHFYFKSSAAGWKLDDVKSVVPRPGWTLSVILKK